MPRLTLSQPSADPAMMKAYVAAGWRDVMLDMEHNPLSEGEVIAAAEALSRAGGTPYVKMASHDPTACMRLFQFGIRHIILPFVEGPEPIRAIRRRVADVFWMNGDDLQLFPLVETRAGLAAIPEICAEEGVAGVRIGPADLGHDLGYSFRTAAELDAVGRELLPVLLDALDAIRLAGKLNGCMLMSGWLDFFPLDRLDEMTLMLADVLAPAHIVKP